MGRLADSWSALTGKQQTNPNPLDKWVMEFLAKNAAYPNPDNEFYLGSYVGNPDVFSVINKITEPASTVPIFQYDKAGNVVNGKMIKLLNNPNSYQSQSLFIEAALSFYYIFGEGFTAYTTLDKSSGSLNAGVPMRLDPLPPQWIKLDLGDYFNPINGYTFYPFSGTDKVDYQKEQVFHWREFNPEYTRTGGHLRGMSRLKPLIKTITGSDEGYNALVKAFQAQGMWGIVTMLEPESNKAVEISKEQKSLLKAGWKRDMKKGDLTVSNHLAHYEKMGLDIKELRVLEALTSLTGKVTNVYNVPDQLFAGSLSKTYLNFKEAERALWANAIKPSLDSFLQGLTQLLAPRFPGEEQTSLQADYSGIEALQYNMVELVGWMVQSQAFKKNEIRVSAGYEIIDTPEMNEVLVSVGMIPISQLMASPDPTLTESVMKELGISDYRKKGKNKVTCKDCGHEFDYNSVPEAGMGYVNCPKCGKPVMQKVNGN